MLYEKKRCFDIHIPRFRERFPIEFVDTVHPWRHACGQHYQIGPELAEETLHERGICRVAVKCREPVRHLCLERTQPVLTARYRSHAYALGNQRLDRCLANPGAASDDHCALAS